MAELLIHEALLLLALDDEKGSRHVDKRANLALAGGILVELAMRQAISFDGETNVIVVQHREIVLPHPSAGLFTECLRAISDGRPEASGKWVGAISAKKDLVHRVAEPLVERRILEKEARKLLRLKGTRYPVRDPGPEAEMTSRLREALLSDTSEPEPRTAAVIALGRAAEILKNNFDKKLLKSREGRITQLAHSHDAIHRVSAGITATRYAPNIEAN